MKTIYALITALLLCSASCPALAQSSVFLDIPGYTDDGSGTGITKNQVQVLALEYSITATKPGDPSATGKAAFSPVVIKKLVDAASMRLQQAVPMGSVIPKVKLIFYTESRGNPRTVTVTYQITLSDVVVTGYSANLSYPAFSDTTPGMLETITMSYGKILVDNRQQRAIGSPESAQPFSWDVMNNKQ